MEFRTSPVPYGCALTFFRERFVGRAEPFHPAIVCARLGQPEPLVRYLRTLRSLAMPIAGSPTLSDLKSPTVAVRCARCRRLNRYRVRRLIEEGGDIRLLDLLARLTASCERRRSPGLYDPCRATLGLVLIASDEQKVFAARREDIDQQTALHRNDAMFEAAGNDEAAARAQALRRARDRHIERPFADKG